MSYGNQWTEINLNSKKNTLIVGKNGSGKSTMLDALSFVLFGKPYRNINKPQLINSITDKNMLVELTFSIGKKHYNIRRGIKPAIFEIYIDDVMVNQNSLTKDYQSYLENNILKLNYKSFCQIVVLGSSNYIPFMQLTANARRLIIEDLLDLQVFSSMNVLLKERLGENKDEVILNDQDIKIIQSNIDLHTSHLKSIQTDQKTQAELINEKIKTSNSLIKSHNKELSNLQTESTNLQTQLDKFIKDHDKLQELNTYLIKIENQRNKIDKEISFYENSCSCPTCKQDIAENHKQQIIKKCKSNLAKLKKNEQTAVNIQQRIQKKYKEKNEISDKVIQNSKKQSEIKTEIYVQTQLLESYKSDLDNIQQKISDLDTSKKDELINSLIGKKEQKKVLIEKREVLSIASQLLKDGGIKTLIIKQYIPVINKIINQYLNHMNFFVEFNLDDNFQETIKSRHRDEFSYNSFSEGEKSRINLAILFAWRAVAKMRNTSSTNLLVFDEIFDSSLDTDGTDDFMKILNTLTGDTNVFIISHKTDNLSDRFDTILKFEKYKNFSRLEVV